MVGGTGGVVAFMAGLPYGQVVTELEDEVTVVVGVGVGFCEAGMGMLTLLLGGGMGAFTETGAFLAE